MNEIRDAGHSLKQMEELDPDIDLEENLVASLNEALFELYEMSVDANELAEVG
ncbi:MAG: hypothetical protein AAF616_15155 [Bacteroidota bacterium]